MEKITCPLAQKKNSFKYFLCGKKLKENKTKLQDARECFAAMCDYQELCTCADGVRMRDDAHLCPLAQKPAADAEPAKTPKRKKK